MKSRELDNRPEIPFSVQAASGTFQWSGPWGGQNGAFGGKLERFGGVGSGGCGGVDRPDRNALIRAIKRLAQRVSVPRSAKPEAIKTIPGKTGKTSPITPSTNNADPALRRTHRQT